MTAVAPDLCLPSVDGGPVRLADCGGDKRALLLFVHEDCPTSMLALDRLASVEGELDRAGIRLVVVAQDPPEIAAAPGPPPPRGHDAGGASALRGRPRRTASRRCRRLILLAPDGEREDTAIGWDGARLEQLLGVALPGEPRWKPGCQCA